MLELNGTSKLRAKPVESVILHVLIVLALLVAMSFIDAFERGIVTLSSAFVEGDQLMCTKIPPVDWYSCSRSVK